MKGGKRKCSIVPTLTVLSSNTELGRWVLGTRGARAECSVLTVGIIYCWDISFPPAANRLHRTSAPTSSSHQDLSQAIKLRMNFCPFEPWLYQLIHTSASYILHIWESLGGTTTCACWSELQNVSANTVLLLQRWIQNTLNQAVVPCSSGEQQSKWKQQNKWYIKSSRKISGLSENSCVLSCDNSLSNSKLCLSLAEERRKLPQNQPVHVSWQDQGLRHHKLFLFGIKILRCCRKFLLENCS